MPMDSGVFDKILKINSLYDPYIIFCVGKNHIVNRKRSKASVVVTGKGQGCPEGGA